MATDSAVRSLTNTLSTTVADSITLTQPWPAIDVTNHDSTNSLYVRQDGTTAVGSADGCTVILPGQSKVLAPMLRSTGASVPHFLSIVGSGNVYTVEGVN